VNQPSAWDEFLARHPEAHILQSREWGELKSRFGWEAHPVIKGEAGALVLLRRLPLGFNLAYIPRGPVPACEHSLAQVLPSLEKLAQSRRVVVLLVEPDLPDSDSSRSEMTRLNLEPSRLTVQPARTIVVNLAGSEDDLLARMKQKTRYNINLARRHGVLVRGSDDTQGFYDLMQETSARDEFASHSQEYYRAAFALFSAQNRVQLLFAENAGRPLAALMVFAKGSRAWYFYGASSSESRQQMAPYLLQWEAMRWARSQGCATYDLWGVPDFDEPALESGFQARADGLWGVYRFKRGFGGRVERTVGTWQRVYAPAVFRVMLLVLRLRRMEAV
jgi:lipid II:glycine glycyltransferase (peptidoglycan interpeptide bridge formation enzyme)